MSPTSSEKDVHIRNVCIYIPSVVYGGTELLLTRLAIFLSSNFKVSVLCDNKSISRSLLKNQDNINLIDKLGGTKFDYLIISAKYLRSIFFKYSFDNYTRVLIWQLHPDEFSTQFFPYVNGFRKYGNKFSILRKLSLNFYRCRIKKVSKLLSILEGNNSIFYMDEANYEETCLWLKMEMKKNIDYLPIVVPEPNVVSFEKITLDKSKINVLIVSRVSFDFKVYPIIGVLDNLNQCNDINFEVNIVGDGDALDFLKEYVNENIFNIVVNFHGFVPIQEVNKFFYPKADVSFGMGTSVLDAGGLGVPAIIMNPHSAYIEYNAIGYSWLYNTKGFSLGKFITKSSINEKHSLSVLMLMLLDNKIEISKKCYNYVKANHSEKNVFQSFLAKMESDEIGIEYAKIYKPLTESIKSNKYIESLIERIMFFRRYVKSLLLKSN